MFPWCTAWPTEVTLRTVAFHLTVGGGGVVFHPSGLRVSGKGSDHRTLHRLEEVEPVRGFLTTMHENGVARGQPREPHSKDTEEGGQSRQGRVGGSQLTRATSPTRQQRHTTGTAVQHNTTRTTEMHTYVHAAVARCTTQDVTHVFTCAHAAPV